MARDFFPHRVVRLRKGGPDGLKLARRFLGPDVMASQLIELVLYALPPVVDEVPAEVFFDDDIVWHQQQFGLPGHVATASIVDDGGDLYVTTLVSDLVQRCGARRRELKTRVEKRFQGWARLLLNAVLDLALERGAGRVLVVRSELAHRNTDRSRVVQRTMFDRVYDGTLGPPFEARPGPRWSVLDVGAHAGVVVRAPVQELPMATGPRICVAHDIERGWGHLDDPALAARMDAEAPGNLERMLAIEERRGVRATYDVVGFLLPSVVDAVRAGGHAVGFHSFDHALPDEPDALDQLDRCREVDYRIKGYRPAQSRRTPDLTDDRLAFHNFEWLASSAHSLRTEVPYLANGVVRIPILLDDFALHEGTPYAAWERDALARLAGREVGVLSLHDCYGSRWLGDYPALLARVAELGELVTLDEVAADVLLSRAF